MRARHPMNEPMDEEDRRIHAEYVDAVVASADLEDIGDEISAFLLRIALAYRTVKRHSGVRAADRSLAIAMRGLRSGRHGAWLARAVEHRVRELASCKP